MSRAANSLKTSDVITTPIKLKYTSSYSYETLGINGIEVWTGSNGPVTITGSVSQDTLNYRSIRHLFYSNFLTGSYLVSASLADNSLQSTAASGTLDADRRYFPTESGAKITVLSIPRKIYGEQISRKGFSISSSITGYWIVDDGNGNVIDRAANNTQVGNIIYSQGLVIVTNSNYLDVLNQPVPGLVYLNNNSIDITVTNAYISDGLGTNYSLTLYSGSALPLAPGQSGSYTVTGSGASNLVVEYSANSGYGTVTGSCNSTIQTGSLVSSSASASLNFNCSLPIAPGSSYIGTINQNSSFTLGQSVSGGVVAYIYQPGDPGYSMDVQHGLIIAPVNIASELPWWNGSNINCNTLPDIGQGLTNTNNIITAQGSGSYAAYVARNYTGSGYVDWFLPSFNEFSRMRENWAVIPSFPLTTGNNYWTSTEPSFPSPVTHAQYLFGSGSASASTTKNATLNFRVRPARYF